MTFGLYVVVLLVGFVLGVGLMAMLVTAREADEQQRRVEEKLAAWRKM